MRSRDVTIPLGLWICAAICAHFVFGTGGLVVAKVHDDRSELWKLSRIASGLAKQGEQTFEISIGDSSEEPKQEVIPPPPKPPEPKAQAPEAPPPDKKAEEPKKPEEKPKPKKDILLVKKQDEKKPLVLPEDTLKDHRIAVRQHAKPDQQDNPNAKFIADQANHVDQETRATQTSHTQDDEHPSPGATHKGTESAQGDSEKTRIADTEDRKGEKNRAPGEHSTDLDVQKEPHVPKTPPQPKIATLETQPSAATRGAAGQDRPSSPAPQAEPQPTPGGASLPSPDVQSAPDGTWTFNPVRPMGAPGQTPQETAGGPAMRIPGGKMWSLPGLGQSAAPGAMNTNLNQGEIATIVGEDNLRHMREADGERRKSEHRGSWIASNFDRWRSAIENYASSVKPGNQTALNTAASPFATYLNGMHNRIHPIFAEAFLDSLDRLPPDHPLNDQSLITRLEIVLTKEGRLKKMGIVKNSGVTAFDIAALDAVDRAQPFGPAPSAIVSADGYVYLHWEFHRDEVYACSTMNARPFILDTPAPSNVEPPRPSPGPGPGKERGAPPSSPNDAREGYLPVRGGGGVTAGAPPSTSQSGT
jgi:TonB family protein